MSARLSFAAAVAAQRRLFFLRLRRRSTLWIVTALCALPPLLAVCLTLFAAGGRNTFTESMELSLVLLPFLPLLFATTLLGDELERHTSDFILARPVARATLLIGRLTALWPVVPPAVIGALLAFVAAYAPQLSDAPAQMRAWRGAVGDGQRLCGVRRAGGSGQCAVPAPHRRGAGRLHRGRRDGHRAAAGRPALDGAPRGTCAALADVPKAASRGLGAAVPPWLSLLVVGPRAPWRCCSPFGVWSKRSRAAKVNG